MKSIYHLLRLTRPLNLAVIALTMGVIQVYLNEDRFSSLYEVHFLLLVFSTVIIGAAGNIINDYFDVKADRVNKPEQMIIDVHIKRRVAILWNWGFNSVGFLIAFYLSWKFSNWWIVLISFVSINTLWFYSMYFKRTFLLGNIFVALLTAIVPLYVFVFDPHHNVFESKMIWIFCWYAFLINLIREIVKDIADIKGDLQLKSETLPIKLGLKKTKIILLFLYVCAMAPLLLIFTMGINSQRDLTVGLSLLTLVILSLMISWLILPSSFYRSKYLLASNMLKLAMLFGLLTPLFL